MWSYQHWDSSNFSNLYDDELVYNDEESIHVCTPPPASISNSSYTHIHPPRINLSMVRIPRKFRTHHHVLNWIGLKHVGVPPTYFYLHVACRNSIRVRLSSQQSACLRWQLVSLVLARSLWSFLWEFFSGLNFSYGILWMFAELELNTYWGFMDGDPCFRKIPSKMIIKLTSKSAHTSSNLSNTSHSNRLPPNSLFPSTFLLFVKERTISSWET